ncbi:MAG: cyclic nucleotide-binding domain-containing protein [Betaproteobacteria bacterium]|nr:MAG: cyclic nucleotide-binding domain-containing protein [Betaproteobacteria bacterium]
MDERPQRLAHLEYLGDAAQFSAQLHALIPRCALLEHFSPAEVRLLAHFMDVYRAAPGAELLREGDGGDFMLMLIEGRVEVRKRDRSGHSRPIATVEAGRTLGEMSMIDGAPRFASCVALEPVLVAALDRENLARIVVEQPMLGAKILMELVLMLSQRLRLTSSRLLESLQEWDAAVPGPL